jgi:hypothetical protein
MAEMSPSTADSSGAVTLVTTAGHAGVRMQYERFGPGAGELPTPCAVTGGESTPGKFESDERAGGAPKEMA